MVRSKNPPSSIPSIEDVARASGVSIATVSRVINNSLRVKERNRQKVLQVIKELNFKPSASAQRLATGKSNVVSLVIPRYEGVFYSFYALELIRGIGTLCYELNLDLLLQLTDARASLNLRGIGGVIFADVIGNRSQLEDALRQGTPCVVINNYIEDLKVSCIAIDNKKGAEEAVDYLISLGHQRIAHISGDVVTQAAADRLAGYEESLRKNKIAINKEYILKTNYSRGEARAAAEKLFSLKERPTAVFVASDSMALEVMAVAREQHKQIPDDLSIIGFDDNPSGLYGPVALTTVHQPLVKMAQDSVKELNRIMNSTKEVRLSKTFLPTKLVIRESCKPVLKNPQR